jgi:hypothetical protein
MESNPERTKLAWKAVKDWITVFDGTATEAYLLDGKFQNLEQAILKLRGQVLDFRIAPIWRDDLDQFEGGEPLSLPELKAVLERGEAVSLSANYQLEMEDQPLDIHLVLEAAGTAASQQLIDINVVWWADQAFPRDSSPEPRFAAVLGHLYSLAGLFGAERLYLGPESLERPRDNPTHWFQV